MNRVIAVFLLWTSLLLGNPVAQGALQIYPPLGRYINLPADEFARNKSFTVGDRIVVTYYFYWYDSSTGDHIVDPDGSDALTTHPPTLTGFSYRFKQWHKKQLSDMIEAGIDVLLPVYWGAPSERFDQSGFCCGTHWSYAGLTPLISAREELLAEGKKPPAIGLFYDTSTLQFNSSGRHIDLATDYGQEWFYESIRDFFSLFPPAHWAMIDGKPIVFLYSAAFAAKQDQKCIDFLKSAFARDFGGKTPYVVREISWKVNTDNVYAWGGALGLENPGVASLGPGYDDSAVPGRAPTRVGRDDGNFYERNWIKLLQNPSNIVAIETWNEFHEATDIAESREYGRKYIDLTRKYVAYFKAGISPRPLPGPYSGARKVEVSLKTRNAEEGLIQIESADGVTSATSVGGSECRASVQTQYPGKYIYFRIHDSFKWTNLMSVTIEVEYFDAGVGRFFLNFDGSDLSAPFQGAYSPSREVTDLAGSSSWKTASFKLTGARFKNSQNSGADFRIALLSDRLHVRSVRVVRPEVPELTVISERKELPFPIAVVLTGQVGRKYLFERSHNLSEWERVLTLTPLTMEKVRVDLGPGSSSYDFFRARLVPD